MLTMDVEIRDPAMGDEAPKAAEALGLGDRYRYFRGRSGRRYLFTAVPAEALADYRGAVVVMEPTTPDSRMKPWFGEIDRHGKRRGRAIPRSRLRRMRIFVHLLAKRAQDRRQVLDDLEGAVGWSEKQ